MLEIREDEYNLLQPMKITPEYAKPLVRDIKKQCRQCDIELKLVDDKTIKTGLGECGGYFDEEELVVACGREVERWLPTLIHESCHMDQWVEEAQVWKDCENNGYDSYSIIETWLAGEVELNTRQLKDHLSRVRALEADCEARTISKIVKHGLPLDVELEIKKANSYIVFYNMVSLTRKWYTVSPTYANSILEAMPASEVIRPEYGNFVVPKRIKELYLRRVF